MMDERLIVAIGRLERALARVETLDLAPLADAATIAARHARLRESTQAAIARLDDLLGAQPVALPAPR